MTLENLHTLFEFKLMGMYSAEKRSLEVLDDAASEARSDALREALQHHREETQGQVERLEKVFETLGRRARVMDASVVEGLVEEKRRFLSEDPTPEVMDVFNLVAAMKNEHVEIAAYESLILLAEQMGMQDVVEPLRQNLTEEQEALDKLRGLSRELLGGVPKAKENARTEVAR